MNYLITGGAGFIGSKLVEKLVKNKSNKIYIIDDFSKKTENTNLLKLFKNKNIKLINKDLKKIAKYLKIYNFDYIYHFAAILGVQNVIENPFKTLRDNIQTTISLINFSKKQKNLKRICFTSTSEVYAHTLKKKLAKYPTPEDIDFLISKDFTPRSSYLLSKIVGEYLLNYSGLKFVIFRPHNIFGPQMGFAHVIPQLTKKIIKDKKGRIIISNSKHKRTFCDIKFAIELIYNISHKKVLNNNIFNIGSPDEEISIFQLAKKITKILKLNKKLIPSISKENNSPEKRKPDMRRSIFYSKIKHNFQKTLEETVLWYKDYYTK